ncbi:MAG: MMPL family transporter [Spirochaetaceae bacterium]|nr:MAG: MMPL family transporter [Spirochaetaceae bacterium]
MKLEFVQRSVGFSVRHSWIVILIAGALTLLLSYHAIHIRIGADIFNMIPQKAKVIEDIARYSTAQDTGQILIAVEGANLFYIEALQVFEAAIQELEANETVIGSINPFNFLTFELEGRRLHPVTAAPGGRAPRNQEDPDICYLFSFSQYLKQMNLKLGGEFSIPDSRAPILLLSRYMNSMLHSSYGRSIPARPINEDYTRFTIFLRTWNAESKDLMMEPEFKELMNQIEQLVEQQLTAAGFRSLRLGLFTLVPMMTGIMLNFIIMVALELPFDVVTVMFSSVAIGVGIDDSIHLIIRFRRQIRIYSGNMNKATVLAHTLKATGRPILLTSLSLVAGLLVLCFSHFLPILYFGILVSLALTTTTFGALVILPAILSFGGGGTTPALPEDRGSRPRSRRA